MSKPGQDQDAIHSTLEKVFARDEFQDKPKDWASFLWDWLKELFDWLGTLYGNSTWLFWLLLVTCLLVLFLLLWHIGISVYRVFYHDRDKRNTDSNGNLRQQLSLQFLRDAESLAERYEYTEAIRHLFLSLVYFYDEKDEFTFRPALTNHEYLQGFIKTKVLHQELSRFVETLDERWYGMKPCSEEDYAAFRASYDHLIKARRSK